MGVLLVAPSLARCPPPCCPKATSRLTLWPFHITTKPPCGPSFISPTRILNKNTPHQRIPKTLHDPSSIGHGECLKQPTHDQKTALRHEGPSMVCSRTESYVVSNIGSCLILKLYGVVHELQAEIRDVEENRLQLRVGRSWLGQLFGSGPPGHPLDVEIQIETLDESADTSHPQAKVEIIVRDRRGFFQSDRFESATQRLLWQLRGYLMVH